MDEILTNPWIVLPCFVGLFVILFLLAFRSLSPKEPTVAEQLQFLQTHPIGEWDQVFAHPVHPVVLAWMADTLLARKPDALRHRTNSVAASHWGGALCRIAESRGAWEDTLLRLAQESESHWCECAVSRNPGATPAVLLALTRSEWSDVRGRASVRLQNHHQVFSAHHWEQILENERYGEALEKRRKAYLLIRPVWQPLHYPEMHSERIHYPKAL